MNSNYTQRILIVRCILLAVMTTGFIILNIKTTLSQPTTKQIRIVGLKIFTEEMILQNANIYSIPSSQLSFTNVSHAIENYLHSLGYTAAKTYLINESGNNIALMVDEGRIEKIIFYNLNTPDTLRMRFIFKLPKNIYNENIVKEQLQWIKNHFKLKAVTARLKSVRDYSDSFFQIDKQLNIFLKDLTGIRLFDEYRPRYDLEINFEPYLPHETKSIRYGFRTSYSKGLIPFFRYIHPSIIAEKDIIEGRISAGIYYGLDRQFQTLPRWSFMETSIQYSLPVLFENYFSPSVSAYLYRSWSSREDLGLSQYEYLIVRGNLIPGINLLRELKAHLSYGVERVYLYKSRPLEGEIPHIAIAEDTDDWTFIEIKMNFDVFPLSIRNVIERSFTVSYAYYIQEASFQKFTLKGIFEFERPTFDIVSFKLNTVLLSSNVPFYYEEPIEHSTFKGFQGKSYHTKKIVRLSTSYRFSLFRDYLFGGLFLDGTIFEGSTYDLVGKQKGTVGGISFHIILLDQFQFNMYYGKDFLLSNKQSAYNVYFDFEKKL